MVSLRIPITLIGIFAESFFSIVFNSFLLLVNVIFLSASKIKSLSILISKSEVLYENATRI
jgi:hypothetical protein